MTPPPDRIPVSEAGPREQDELDQALQVPQDHPGMYAHTTRFR